jgi:site-specific recombinase XerD
MSIDLRAAATEYLRARRARGHQLAKHGQVISSFLDGLAPNATTITRDNAVAFATAPAGTGRAWQASRLSTIRGFAAYVHGLDPEAAQLIPGRLLPARYPRRIPYLYSAAQIRDLLTTSTALLPQPRNLTMTAFLGLIAATGMRAGETIALDSDDFDADQGLLTVTGKYRRQRVLPLHPGTVTALTDSVSGRAGYQCRLDPSTRVRASSPAVRRLHIYGAPAAQGPGHASSPGSRRRYGPDLPDRTWGGSPSSVGGTGAPK